MKIISYYQEEIIHKSTNTKPIVYELTIKVKGNLHEIKSIYQKFYSILERNEKGNTNANT